MKHILATCILALSTAAAFGQGALIQGGSSTAGRAPMYSSTGTGQTVVQDSGPASGGAAGLGLKELLLVKRGTGTPPIANQGTGPLNTSACIYDAPINNAAGYHYLCLDPNAQGGGLVAYGAGGGASQLPLQFNVNGQFYQFPFTSQGVLGPGSTTVGDCATWNNTSGTLVADTPCRKRLTANADYYVAPVAAGGSNSNSCLSGAPCLTLQYVVDLVYKTLDLGGNDVTIHVTDGSYTLGVNINGPQVGFGTISIVGNIGTPSAVDINAAGSRVFNLSNGAFLTVSGVKMRASLENIKVTSGAQLTISAYEHGAAGQHVEVDTGGRLYSTGNYTISGPAAVHMHVNKNGFASITGGLANISVANLNFPTFFFGASQTSSIFFDTFSYGGTGFATVTGQAYFIHSQAMVDLGVGVNPKTFFPGAGAAGSTLNAGGNLNGTFGNSTFGLGDTPTTVSAMGNTSGTGCGAKVGTGDGTVLLGQLGTWSAIFGGGCDQGTTLSSSNTMTLLSADGKTSGGRGNGNYTIAANGPASGTGGGARVQAENSAVTRAAIGNWSAFSGGAYDGTGTLFTAGPMRLFAGDSSTFSCASGIKSDGNGQLSCIPSARRFKDDIVGLRETDRPSPEDVLRSLRPVQFVLKDDPERSPRAGLIAEEVEQVDKRLVFYNTKGDILGVDYNGVLAELLAVAQQQQDRNTGLERYIAVITLVFACGFIVVLLPRRRRIA